jgi:hypothetical protein
MVADNKTQMVILTGLTKYLFTRDCLLFTCLPEQFYPWGLNTGDAVAHHHAGGLSPSQAKSAHAYPWRRTRRRGGAADEQQGL